MTARPSRTPSTIPVRPGFTLIELLVVTGVILVLASLAVSIVPRTLEKKKVANSASQLQAWFLSARQWAMRDQAPRGIRLNDVGSGPNGWKQVATLTYIEQPDDFIAPPGSSVTLAPCSTWTDIVALPNLFSGGAVQALFQGGQIVRASQQTPVVDFSGGSYVSGTFPTAAQIAQSWPIQKGDLIEFGSGAQAQILAIRDIQQTQISPTNTVKQIALITGPASNTAVANPNMNSLWQSQDFRIIRQPRPKRGEPLLQLPALQVSGSSPATYAGVVIDLSVNNTSRPSAYQTMLPTQTPGINSNYIDIMFAPSGQVLVNGLSGGGDIKLWIRDTTEDSPVAGNLNVFGGEQYIVNVTIRTGMISIQPVNTDTGTSNPAAYTAPYSFTYGGVYSGI